MILIIFFIVKLLFVLNIDAQAYEKIAYWQQYLQKYFFIFTMKIFFEKVFGNVLL